MRGISADGITNLSSQILYAEQTIQLRAQLIVIHHIAEFRDARGQRLFAILRKEEAGIRQARAHHALVAADDVLGVGNRHVGDDQELIAQLA